MPIKSRRKDENPADQSKIACETQESAQQAQHEECSSEIGDRIQTSDKLHGEFVKARRFAKPVVR